MTDRPVSFHERILGIVELLNVRAGEASAALVFIQGISVDNDNSEALHAYKIARALELKLSFDVCNRKVNQLLQMLENTEHTDADAVAVVLDLDDFR